MATSPGVKTNSPIIQSPRELHRCTGGDVQPPPPPPPLPCATLHGGNGSKHTEKVPRMQNSRVNPNHQSRRKKISFYQPRFLDHNDKDSICRPYKSSTRSRFQGHNNDCLALHSQKRTSPPTSPLVRPQSQGQRNFRAKRSAGKTGRGSGYRIKHQVSQHQEARKRKWLPSYQSEEDRNAYAETNSKSFPEVAPVPKQSSIYRAERGTTNWDTKTQYLPVRSPDLWRDEGMEPVSNHHLNVNRHVTQDVPQDFDSRDQSDPGMYSDEDEKQKVGPETSLTLDDWIGPYSSFASYAFSKEIQFSFHLAAHPALSSAIYWLSLQHEKDFVSFPLHRQLENMSIETQKRARSNSQTTVQSKRVKRIFKRRTIPLIAKLIEEGRLRDHNDVENECSSEFDLSEQEFDLLLQQLSSEPIYEEHEEEYYVDEIVNNQDNDQDEKQVGSSLNLFESGIALRRSWLHRKNDLELTLFDVNDQLNSSDEQLLSDAEERSNSGPCYGALDNKLCADDELNEGDMWILMESNEYDHSTTRKTDSARRDSMPSKNEDRWTSKYNKSEGSTTVSPGVAYKAEIPRSNFSQRNLQRRQADTSKQRQQVGRRSNTPLKQPYPLQHYPSTILCRETESEGDGIQRNSLETEELMELSGSSFVPRRR